MEFSAPPGMHFVVNEVVRAACFVLLRGFLPLTVSGIKFPCAHPFCQNALTMSHHVSPCLTISGKMRSPFLAKCAHPFWQNALTLSAYAEGGPKFGPQRHLAENKIGSLGEVPQTHLRVSTSTHLAVLDSNV